MKTIRMILIIAVLIIINSSALASPTSDPIVMTVQGAIEPNRLGATLAHEHILIDFLGADETGPHRWDVNEVCETMQPYLVDLRERGFTGFVDATPPWFGRDTRVLARLARETGLHIIMPTGIYAAVEDRYVPSFMFDWSVEQIARLFIDEARNGVGTDAVRPGFIKLSVDRGSLSDFDRKLVCAAALAHQQTGLPVACHIYDKEGALDVLQTALDAGIAPASLIVVHVCDVEEFDVHLQIARAGAWVEYDKVSRQNVRKYVRLVRRMIDAGHIEQVLLAHDAGWYEAGQPRGGWKRPYTAISDRLLPALEKAGVTKDQIHTLTVSNPAKAFSFVPRPNETVPGTNPVK